jgi:hypothetical protein
MNCSAFAIGTYINIIQYYYTAPPSEAGLKQQVESVNQNQFLLFEGNVKDFWYNFKIIITLRF